MKTLKYLIECMILNESYINMIGNKGKHLELKQKYVDIVWDMLQESYKPIGGIKGSGFKSKQDMIDNIPFWKLRTSDSKVKLIIMYKDKNGRKSVAMATDKSEESKKMLVDEITQEFKRSWGEKSGPLLWVVYKNLENIFDDYVIDTNTVKRLLPDDNIIPYIDYKGDIDANDKLLLSKINTKYHKYFYIREFGGSVHLKMALGTINKNIKT